MDRQLKQPNIKKWKCKIVENAFSVYVILNCVWNVKIMPKKIKMKTFLSQTWKGAFCCSGPFYLLFSEVRCIGVLLNAWNPKKVLYVFMLCYIKSNFVLNVFVRSKRNNFLSQPWKGVFCCPVPQTRLL